MAATAQEFYDHLAQSGLMSSDEIQTFREALPAEFRRARAEDLAKEFVRQKKLTRFQATAIYQGKIKGLIFGKYEILDKVGAGGMGQVYRARQRHTERIVALKVLAGAARKSEKAVRRFKQEVETAGRLLHRNIVVTLDAGEVTGVNYLVMEYIHGADLRTQVKERGRLPVPEVIGHILQVAEGLDYAHRENIVHRDIKPSNLLLDRDGNVKILDMGLARIQDPDEDPDDPDAGRLTMAGQMLGTAEYMSPEQVEDPRYADARSDIYSLGCTMYYLLNGKPPYRGETTAQTLMAHELTPIPPLAGRRDDISPSLDAVFHKMLAKDVNERYQSMAEVIAALKAAALIAAPAGVPGVDVAPERLDDTDSSESDGYSTLNTLALQSPSLFGEPPPGFRPRSASISAAGVSAATPPAGARKTAEIPKITPGSAAKAPAPAISAPVAARGPASSGAIPAATAGAGESSRKSAGPWYRQKRAKPVLLAVTVLVLAGLVALLVMQLT